VGVVCDFAMRETRFPRPNTSATAPRLVVVCVAAGLVFFVCFPAGQKGSWCASSSSREVRVPDIWDDSMSRAQAIRQCFEPVPQRFVVIAETKPFLAEPLPSEVELDTAAPASVGSGSQRGRTRFYPKFLQPSVFRGGFEQLVPVDGIAADLQLIDDCR